MDITILGRELAINKYVFIFHHKHDPYSCALLAFLLRFLISLVCPGRGPLPFEGLFDDVLGWGTRDIAKKVPLSLIVHRYLPDFKSLKVKVLNCYSERPKQDDPRCSSSS